MRRWLRSTLPVFALCAAARPAHGAGRERAGKVPVADTQPVWASPSNLAGADANADQVVFSVWLGWSRNGELDRTLAGLYDPASPTYHQWLTPDQFHARFSPPASDVAAVQRWLSSEGFSIVDVPVEPPLRGGRGLGRPGRAGVRREREHVPRRRLRPARAEPRPGRARGGRAARQRDHRPRRRDDARAPERRHAPAAARRHVRRAVLELLGPAHLVGLHEPVRTGPAALAHLRLPALPDRLGVRDRPACTPPASTAAARRSRSRARSSRRRSARTSPTSRAASTSTTVTASSSTTTARPASTTARSSRRARSGSRRTRPRRRAGTSSRRSTSSGPTPSRRGRRSSTSAPPTTPAGSTWP